VDASAEQPVLARRAPFERLQVLVDRGKEARPDLRGRLERAAMIVALRNIRPQSDGSYLVESERYTGCFYRVSTRCQCVDQSRAPDGWCKHRLAVRLHAALARDSGDATPPDPPPNTSAEVKMHREADRQLETNDRHASRVRRRSVDHLRTAREQAITRLALVEAAAQFCASRPGVRPHDVVRVARSWERWLQQALSHSTANA
jgi:hypothetical protein